MIRRRERLGTEPSNARSAYMLRAVLASIGLVVTGPAAVALGVAASRDSAHSSRWGGLAAVCGLLFLAAAADLVVVLLRIREEHRPLL